VVICEFKLLNFGNLIFSLCILDNLQGFTPPGKLDTDTPLRRGIFHCCIVIILGKDHLNDVVDCIDSHIYSYKKSNPDSQFILKMIILKA
jgi:hypothetical protein